MNDRLIYKYILEISETNVLDLGVNDRVLTAQTQGDHIALWVIHWPHHHKVKRAFRIYGTGTLISPNDGVGGYINTVQLNGYVYHIFEVSHA
jgi:hypothetical protein